MPGINDNALWAQEFHRQVQTIKASLQSLRLQAERRREKPHSSGVKKMAFVFSQVDEAFAALNKSEPERPNPNGDLIPEPKNRWVGRREFLSDLKGDDR